MTGSFGLLKPHYSVTPGRVTIARNTWLPIVLLALAAPGAYFLSQAFGHKLDTGMFALGFVGVMCGVFALVMTPWLTPGTITFTREGVAWGGTKFPLQMIKAVRAQSSEVRSSQYGKYLSWSIVVALANGKPLLLSLGSKHRGASTEPLMALERAIGAVLSGSA